MEPSLHPRDTECTTPADNDACRNADSRDAEANDSEFISEAVTVADVRVHLHY